MTRRIVVAVLVLSIINIVNMAQDICVNDAFNSIDRLRIDYSSDISKFFAEIDTIEVNYRDCISETTETDLSTEQVVDGGHIVEGLWYIHEERTQSDACTDRKKQEIDDFYEDVYYDDDGLLIWDAGNKFSNFAFEYLLARRYTANESGNNWVYEREITSATETTMAGTYVAYWQETRMYGVQLMVCSQLDF